MIKFNLYFASCVLLLTLNWRTSTGLPLPDPSANSSALCAPLFKTLLKDITGFLETEDLCSRFFTSSEVTVPSDGTVQACAPTGTQISGCVMQRNSSFSETECRRNIMKDLVFYEAAINSYLQSQLHMPEREEPLLRPVLRIIQDLRTDCSTAASGENNSSEEAANLWRDNSFTNRQKMCKMMRGFHVRAITINRAMGYISSGDHRK